MNKKKRFSARDLEPVAQEAIATAIQKALSEGAEDLTEDQKTKLFRVMSGDDNAYTFELCLHPENATWDSKEALIVARALIDRYSGEIVGHVKVFLPPVLAWD